jgi:hypothetical protein
MTEARCQRVDLPGTNGSGVPMGMVGCVLVDAWNSPTIFNIGVTTQLSAVGFSSRGSVYRLMM